MTRQPTRGHVKVLGTNGGFSYTWRSAIFHRAMGTLPVAIVPYEESFREMDDYLLTKCIASGEAPPSSLEHAAAAPELIECSETSIRRNCLQPAISAKRAPRDLTSLDPNPRGVPSPLSRIQQLVS